MASAFGHALAAIALGNSYSKKIADLKFFVLGVICSIIPDADVISFSFGISYGSFWGHRGFTHSLLFALLFGIVITLIFYKKFLSKQGAIYLLFFTLCTASHGLLDALTSGGLGVAFFSPFNNTRYFFPCRPIQVSPLGVGHFFSKWGLEVLWSEFIWIGIPGTVYIVLARILRKRN